MGRVRLHRPVAMDLHRRRRQAPAIALPDDRGRRPSAPARPAARRRVARAPDAARPDERLPVAALKPDPELKPCPACGQRAGALKTLTAARFPYYVACSACGWST